MNPAPQHKAESGDDELDEALLILWSRLSGGTILHEPEKRAMAEAKQKIETIIQRETVAARISELKSLHRFDGKDYDTEYDEEIDERIERLVLTQG